MGRQKRAKAPQEINNKIYAFFSLLCLCISNYFVLKILYQDAISHFYVAFLLITWINSLFWILVIFLLLRNKIKNEGPKKILFFMAFMIITFILTVFFDRFIGLLGNYNLDTTSAKGLIFNPNTTAHYSTTEFDFEARINSLGLRDKEIPDKSEKNKRILCFGDSFTFGYGVKAKDSWPKVLEKYFANKGYQVEVINCGRGGAYTTLYKKYMEEIIPKLKPDIVLLGVLQLDDLAQLYENQFPITQRVKPNKIRTVGNKILKIIKVSYKNLVYLYNKGIDNHKEDVANTWKIQSHTIISKFSKLESLRYNTFDDSVKKMFEGGNLNPVLIQYLLGFPDRLLIFNNPTHPATKFAINKMKNDIKYMKDFCDKNQCELVFVNLPNASFTGHYLIRNPNLDFLINKFLYDNNKIDAIYRDIAIKNNLEYCELTSIFKNLSQHSNDKYFYPYDGHPNSKGYSIIGQSIGEFLIQSGLICQKRN